MMLKKLTKLAKKLSSAVACALVLVIAASCSFFVKPPAEPTTVTLSETAISIGIGDSKRLTATVSDDSDVSWTSSNEKVATVSTSGVVRGVAAGTADVTATANGVTATCVVTVENIYVKISKTELTLDVEREDEKTATLTATVMSGDKALTDEKITWSTSDSNIASVENGVVTAVSEGTATITAKRSSGAATATCEVTVTWKDKPAGYTTIGFSEQNKAVTNTYGYWNDQGWEFGTTEMYNAYYADSANSQAGKATFDFEVLSRNEGKQTAPSIQVTYRSSKDQDDGMLEVGYFYTLDMDILSTVAGEVIVNDYAVNGQLEELKDEVYNFPLEANVVKHITVKFAHYDDGRIHESTDYSNVESALHLLLGSLDGRAVVTIDNLVWTKGEQAPEKPDAEPEKPAVSVPDLSAVEAIALDIDAENVDNGEAEDGQEGVYDIAKNDEGKSYTIGYTTYSSTYQHIIVNLANTQAANSNTFAVTIKNNGESTINIRFDIAGAEHNNGTNPESRDCALSAVATVGTPNVDLSWDGTSLDVEAGVETVLYITYEVDGAAGAPTELLVYFHSGWYGTSESNWAAIKQERSGNVTLSDFKFATVKAPGIEVPAVDSITLGDFNLSEGAGYEVTPAEDNKSITVDYTDITGGTYANISTDIADIAKDCNTFSVKIKNNGETSINLRFDICGSNEITVGNNNASKDLNLDMVAIGGTAVRTDLEWDGSFITVAAGEEATIVLTYGVNEAIGEPIELLIFIDSSVYQDTNKYTGNVTFSEFKFANV